MSQDDSLNNDFSREEAYSSVKNGMFNDKDPFKVKSRLKKVAEQ